MRFKVVNVDFRDNGRQRTLMMIRKLRLHCTRCSTDWHANHGSGPGKFIFLTDAIRVTCQFCSWEEDLTLPEISYDSQKGIRNDQQM